MSPGFSKSKARFTAGARRNRLVGDDGVSAGPRPPVRAIMRSTGIGTLSQVAAIRSR